MRKGLGAFGVIQLVGLLSTTSAFAQAPVESTEAETTQEQGGVASASDEIIVTATRQREVLSRVPVSVSAYGQERLDQLGIKDFEQIARQTPGVRIEGTNISIRGIASDAGAATTGVYIDDTPIQIRVFGNGAQGGRPTIFDLDRVEVLRGPQGTLFGAGSVGGTVRYITPQPSLTEYSVYARGEISGTQSGEANFEGGVAVGGPIVKDKLGFRVSVYDRRDGGWVDHVDYHDGSIIDKNSNWSNSFAARAALAFQPVDGLVITPAVDYQRRYTNDTDAYWEFYTDRKARKFGNGNPVQTSDKDWFALPSLKIEGEFGKVSLISNTSYFHRNQVGHYDGSMSFLGALDGAFAEATGTPGLILPANGPNWEAYGVYDFAATGITANYQRNWTQEVRLQSNDPDATLSWVIGGFYQSNKQTNLEILPTPQLPQIVETLLGGDGLEMFFGVPDLLPGDLSYYGPTTVKEKQIAGFANVTLSLTDKLKITAGARISRIKFSYDSLVQYPGVEEISSGGTTSTPFTPKVNISYQITPEHMVYATAAKGFRMGGVNQPLLPICVPIVEQLGLETPTREYDPDSVWSYEIGAKGRVSGGKFNYSASAYRIDWSNIQQSTALAQCGYSYIDNLGTARVQGFDLQGSAKLTDFFTLEFAVGYTDAKYSKTTFFSPAPGSAIAVNKGNSLDGVVPWTVVIGGMSDFKIGDHPAYARFNYEYSSKAARGPEQDPATGVYDPGLPVEPPTHVVRARAGMVFDDVDVSLFVDNLFDAAPRQNRAHENVSTLLYTGTTLRPRTAGVSVTYRY